MLVYFDNNKNAFLTKIKNYIATVDDNTWQQYAGTDKWDIVDGVFTDITNTEEYKQKQAEKEQERINNLTMTALDFIGVLQQFGLTLEQINAFLESNLQIKMQLTYCQNVYCGVVKQFLPVVIGDIKITTEMVERAFKIKNGEDEVK